ncbi:diphosphomevalonate decarboxylase [Polyangium sp. y55x31]|uniref:diphosphomevalonate decarboxylase n=1 Tax=Polyangium sp. y55x31 TaxID=3042688 RepID=UPI0024821246|nr:diphosphomevalonate decarboxylase [Polyangium sp. y55x31]MDI1475664.1 diphosphomevalonate decarboxylase [Polyangium sp. y55x31]
MTIRAAKATAHPNIALAKYWGKRADGVNQPAVPSLSVTLAGMATTTTVTFDPALAEDTFLLGGAPADEVAHGRVVKLLDRVRGASGITERARVESSNDFPTASGLASSASGFSALALAALSAAGLDTAPTRVSDLARRISVSAARSAFGGFVELPVGSPGEGDLAAVPVAPPEHLPMRIVVAVTREGPKAVSSTNGMEHTVRTSPYFPAWVESAPALCARVRDAILRRDLEALGVAAEESALAMHATSIAARPGLLYWNGGTVEALEEVRRLRARGLLAYATIDAGPHVKVLTTPEDEPRVTAALAEVPGVKRTIVTSPGEGARILDRT